jgi:hypothetical protein
MELFFFRKSLKRIIEELCIRFLFIGLLYIFPQEIKESKLKTELIKNIYVLFDIFVYYKRIL